MAVTHNIIQLSDSDPVAVSVTGQHAGRDITIQNISNSAYVYIGGEGLSVENYGYCIDPNSSFSVELRQQEVIYGVTSENGSSVAVIQLGLESETN
jgi:hypothetical protein